MSVISSRNVAGSLAVLTSVLLVAISIAWILDLATVVRIPLYDEQPLALCLGLGMAIIVLSWAIPRTPATRLTAVCFAAALILLVSVVAYRYPDLTMIAMQRPMWLVMIAVVIGLSLMLLVWKTTGIAIVAIVATLSLVAVFGSVFGMPETAADRFALYMLIDPNGMLGLPLRVAIEIVVPFILFGELLRQSGGSDYLTKLSLAAFGRYRGGSAKAACAASAAFGSISGNAVSNVVGTGIVTIPLMKKTGMADDAAAAIEASASTGGQLLPPVMGSAAFVMADYLQIPYTHVALAALLPALLYFSALFIQIDRIAARDGVMGVEENDSLPLKNVFFSGIHLLTPFAVLFYVLSNAQTRPGLAALAAVASLIVVSLLRPFDGKRLSLSKIMQAVIDCGRTVAPLILITAAAGLIIGLISLTGLGFSISSDVVAVSDGNTIVLLLLVALIAIVFGMGMPTVAVYIVLATVLAPALVESGVGQLQAHMFILYFGMMSMLTPPVALASIAAAKISGSDMWKTSFLAMKLAWVAYVVPFLFAFSPELLLGGTATGAGLAAVTAFAGISALSFASIGWARSALSVYLRIAYAAAGVALILPPTLGLWAIIANVVGACLFAALFFWRTESTSTAGSELR